MENRDAFMQTLPGSSAASRVNSLSHCPRRMQRR
jgi:hypothetical protein